MNLGESKKFMYSILLMLTALFSSLILTIVYLGVKPSIVKQQKEALNSTLKTAWADQKPIEADSVSALKPFIYTIGGSVKAEIEKHFIVKDQGESFLVKSTGRNGPIKTFISLDTAGNVLTFDIIEQAETKGIWENANRGYKTKIGYRDLSAVNLQGTKPEKGQVDFRIIANSKPNQIQSGATLTSTGIRYAFRGVYHFINSSTYTGQLPKGGQ